MQNKFPITKQVTNVNQLYNNKNKKKYLQKGVSFVLIGGYFFNRMWEGNQLKQTTTTKLEAHPLLIFSHPLFIHISNVFFFFEEKK